MTAVIRPFRTRANRRRARKPGRASTSAVAAESIMITGASTMIANAKATPWAARLYLGSGRRAMTAARKGPSTAIISQVACRGSQNRERRRSVIGVPGILAR